MEVESNKDTSIKSWWKKVTHNSNNKPVSLKQDDQIFGVPLQDSLKCASAAIAYVDNDVQYVGLIPLIVAKCGSYLKGQGLYTEGVFRLSGSAKRIGELQQIFNSFPNYGKQLDWKGFSVHDAANVLRQFLNYLPEPVIVHHLYQSFRDVILNEHTEAERVVLFQSLIEQLPEHHQYLLFYLLDLLSLFSQQVQITKMDTFNLASVFTPGILLNPEHAMNPAQYKTSQKVVQFLVEHQHCFKMPRSSPFNQQQQQQQQEQQQGQGQNVTQEKDQKSSISSPPPAGTPAHRHNSQPHHSTTTTTSTFNNYNTHKQSIDLNTDSLFPTAFPTRPTSVDLSAHKQQKVKRAKTMPSRRSKYGPNDPLQIVQLNKSVAETTMIN
ncbi:unnamed protein product [Mucor hiemalis]